MANQRNSAREICCSYCYYFAGAFAYLRKQMPDVFLADTMIYLSEESKFFDYMQANKGLLMHIAFIPLITWKTIRVLDRVNSNLIDGFVVMPYDILFLKRKIDIAIARTTDKNICLKSFCRMKLPFVPRKMWRKMHL